jgi:N-dimethylarginine dimethylaminohydrolase
MNTEYMRNMRLLFASIAEPNLIVMSTAVHPASATPATLRVTRARHYLMCPPDHFTVAYVINPWMDPTGSVDVALARRQWDGLRAIYRDLGHAVHTVEPEPGLPDMVYAANGGLVIDGRALGARFAHPQRAREGPAYLHRLRAAGLRSVIAPTQVNEGEGDFLVIGTGRRARVLAGTGFRTMPSAHAEVRRLFGLPVTSLRLVDPRFYHLDTALAVLDDETVAYYPPAFGPGSRRLLARMFPDAILAGEADAAVLGLNAVSDGRHVVLAHAAVRLAAQLRERGFEPIGVDLSELLKGGGGAKCCTLELRP